MLKGLWTGQANKFLVSVLGAVATSLTSYYGTRTWEPMVFAIITAIGTYLIPNLPKQ